MKTVLTHCTVIDCTGKPPKKNMTVVIEGDKIAALQPGGYQGAAGGKERVFDLEGGYVLPGLWNCHVHLGGLLPDPKHIQARESAVENAIRAGRDAIDALRVGVTGLRVVGQRDGVDIAWRDAFNAGVFVGPRMFVCGKSISATGGHGDLGRDEPSGRADGPYEMRKAVRERLKRGVDQIKLCVSGGHAEVIAGAGEDEQAYLQSQLFLDEIQAATEVAHQKGKRVCVHGGGEAMKVAIRGGVDCIEHGYFMDDETIELMLEHDVYYDPTLVCNSDEQVMLDHGGLDKFHKGRVLVIKSEKVTPKYAQIHKEGVQKAYKAGVKIVTGGDSVPSGMFTLWELENLVWAGMTEMDALMAATRTSADLCGVVDKLGTVEEDKLADLIVLAANPLDNIRNIHKLKHVFKGGKPVDIGEPEGLADFWELFFFD
jgi:imidazolonepropionase-like amidohydrolase